MTSSGAVRVECDNHHAESGGPLLCKSGVGPWLLVGIPDGDNCTRTYSEEECYNVKGGEEYSDKNTNFAAPIYSPVIKEIEKAYQ